MATELSKKYPDYAFVKVSTFSKDIRLNKEKYMVNNDVLVHQFMLNMRMSSNAKIDPNKSITFLVNNMMPRPTEHMGTLYNKYKKEDGIMYVNIETENVFG